jgi:hypothetical protein
MKELKLLKHVMALIILRRAILLNRALGVLTLENALKQAYARVLRHLKLIVIGCQITV